MFRLGGRTVACSVFAAWLLADAAPACAGAFTLRPGEAKLFVSGLVTAGDHYFDSRGKLRSRGRYRKYDLQAFAEYGLRDGLTVFGSSALEKISAKDGTTSTRKGLGRSELGARFRVFEAQGWIASAQASFTLAGARKSEGLAAVGETDDQLDLRGLVAHSFEAFGRHWFLDLQAGYRARSGDPADELRFDATLGARLAPRWLVLAQSFNTIGLARWKGPYALKQRIHKLQGAALFDLTERLTIYAAAFVTPIGKDALDERGGSLGIGYRF